MRAGAHLGVRVLAFWFGTFTLLNVAGTLIHPNFDANLWWIDLRFLPDPLRPSILVAAGLALVAHAIRPPACGWRRAAAPIALAALTTGAIVNTVSYYRTWNAGQISPKMPFPLSLVLSVAFVILAIVMRRRAAAALGRRARLAVIAAVTAALVIVLPLAQFVFFGTTDYRRPADVIVVFGAKADPGGKASVSLADRVFTATQLYEQGLAPKIIMSGGIEPTAYDEAQVMATLAEEEGVPGSAIILDHNGYNTQASVNDTVNIFREDGFKRILAVSHFYHLPRIKLAYARAGIDVWTVPPRDTPISLTPLIVAREIPAFWLYYVRAAL